MLILLAACGNKPSSSSDDYGPKAADIFGNPDYQAFSYGGYLEKTRDIAPTHEQITEDLKILAAMGVKILRTYNTSQFPQAALLLNAIKELKATLVYEK